MGNIVAFIKFLIESKQEGYNVYNYIDFKIVVNTYNPFSVKTLGRIRDFVDMFAVEFFDRKSITSLLVS